MLRTRLYFGLLPLLLLFIAVGMSAMLICRDLADSIEKKLLVSYRMMIGCYEMREAAGLMTQALHEAQSGRILEAKSPFNEYRGRFQKVLMDQSFSSAGTTRMDAVSRIAEAFDGMSALGNEIFSHGASASLQSYQRTETAFFETLRTLQETNERDYADLKAEAGRVSRIMRASVNAIAAALVGGILLSLFLSYRLARSLLSPIRALTSSATALGEGNLDKDVPVTSNDELGDLARAFNTMAAKLRLYREATTARVMRAQRTMEATLTSTPDPLFVISRDGTQEVRNPAAEALAASPEFSGKLPPELEEPLKEVLATGQHFLPSGYDRVITVHLGADERHFLPRILAIGDSLTGFGGAAMILQDVTKFRLLDDAKSNLVGTVSHELKTPLTSLRMGVYLLLEHKMGQLTPSQRDLLETVRDDADRLLRILNDLLDLARLESGASSLNPREVVVRTMLEDMAREMKPIAEAAEQKIEISVATGITAVRVDPERLRHVFINLLSNASKYSPMEKIITLYAEAAEQGCLRFGVRDQGPGIPPTSLPHIFERFYRVPGQTRKGAGLGLTIAREIVTAHGGTISCSSEPGQGSDFFFLLPLHGN